MKAYAKQLALLCFICAILFSGCSSQSSAAEKEVMDYLTSLESQGMIDLDAMTENQLQRLLEAGPDGVAAELSEMADEILSALPTGTVLAPVMEYLRGYRTEQDGKTYAIDLEKVAGDALDELLDAYTAGGADKLAETVQAKLDSGWDVLTRDFQS